jgi:hypothetical protein
MENKVIVIIIILFISTAIRKSEIVEAKTMFELFDNVVY